MKKKNKKLNLIVPLIVYPFDVMFSFNETDRELKKHLKNYKIEVNDITLSFTERGRTTMFEGNQTIIRLKSFPTNSEDYGYLAHEIFHAVTIIMDRIGMKFNPFKSDEAYAYLIGYLTQKIYEKL